MKPLGEGKSRLSQILSNEAREAQNRSFLERALSVAESFPGAASTLVVSRDAEVLDSARSRGMMAFPEAVESDLNVALSSGALFAQERGFRSMLYLPVDLPFLEAQSLRQIVDYAEPPCLVLVPDRHRKGTNILYQSPIRLTRFAFGECSFEKHCALGRDAGLEVMLPDIENLQFDIDDPRDLMDLRNAKPPALS